MFSTDFIFRQQENLVDNQKCQAGFRLLCNKILFCTLMLCIEGTIHKIQFYRKSLEKEALIKLVNQVGFTDWYICQLTSEQFYIRGSRKGNLS